MVTTWAVVIRPKFFIESEKGLFFQAITGKDCVTTRVLFGITPKGYYVAIADCENNACIPKEWSTLKSFFNGEKKYIRLK